MLVYGADYIASLQSQFAAVSISPPSPRLLTLLEAEEGQGAYRNMTPAIQRVVAEFFTFEPEDIPLLMRHVTNRPSENPHYRAKMESLSLRLQHCLRELGLIPSVETIAEALLAPQSPGSTSATSTPLSCLQLISEYAEEPMGATEAFFIPLTWRIKALCLAVHETPTDLDRKKLEAAFEIFADLLKKSAPIEFLYNFKWVFEFKKEEGIFGKEMGRFFVKFCNVHLREKYESVVADILQAPETYSTAQRNCFRFVLEELLRAYSEVKKAACEPSVEVLKPAAGFEQQLLYYYIAFATLYSGEERVAIYMHVMYLAQGPAPFGKVMQQLEGRLQRITPLERLEGLKPWVAYVPQYIALSTSEQERIDRFLSYSYKELKTLSEASQDMSALDLVDAVMWQLMALDYQLRFLMNAEKLYKGEQNERTVQNAQKGMRERISLLLKYIQRVSIIEYANCVYKIYSSAELPTEFGDTCRYILEKITHSMIKSRIEQLCTLQGSDNEAIKIAVERLMSICICKIDQSSYKGIIVRFDLNSESAADTAQALLIDYIDPFIKKFESIFTTDEWLSIVCKRSKNENRFMQINYSLLHERLKKLIGRRASATAALVHSSDDYKV